MIATHRAPLIAALALAFAFFLAGLNRVPVATLDGAHRAAMARHIVTTGQWYPPVFQGQVIADHPPLYIWLVALSFKVFGINDFAANLPGRLFAFGAVLVTFALALSLGYSPGLALLAALILCLTRDFVLGCVRGYIEPMIDVFAYAGLGLALFQKRRSVLWPSVAAGLCVVLVAFAKGPVAAWPLLFIGFLLRRRHRQLTAYVLTVMIAASLWMLWVERAGHWDYWREYWNSQIIESAAHGRGHSQQFDPFFFAKILLQYYWPWLPFLAYAVFRTLGRAKRRGDESNALIFLVFGLGFIAGFSAVRFKFWYYITPAYPAFSLFLAIVYKDKLEAWAARPALARTVAAVSLVWIALSAWAPLELHRERVPEVVAFRETIRLSPLKGPVYCVDIPNDYNFIDKSGHWYFDRRVERVLDEDTWEKTVLKAPSWVLAGLEHWRSCSRAWCKQGLLVQTQGRTALIYVR